jgi:hypothetical protein
MMIDSVSAAGTWWCPSLSLSAEAEMTACRQAAARMSRDELAVHLDAMIITCFNQRAVIKAATHHVAGLEARRLSAKLSARGAALSTAAILLRDVGHAFKVLDRVVINIGPAAKD